MPEEKWSYTKINTFIRCPMMFKHQYVDKIKIKKKSYPLALGACMASGVEGFRGGCTTKNEAGVDVNIPAGTFAAATEAFMQTWNDEASSLPLYKEEDPLRSVERGLEILKAYTEEYPDEPELILQPEISFEEEIAPGIIFRGRLDGVIRDRTGVGIIEDKTVSRLGPAWFREKRSSYQIKWYMMVAKQLGLYDVYEGDLPRAVINAIYIHKDTLRFEREPVMMMDKALETAKMDLINWVGHIRRTMDSGVYPQADYNECSKFGGCDFWPLREASPKARKMLLASNYSVSDPNSHYKVADEVPQTQIK